MRFQVRQKVFSLADTYTINDYGSSYSGDSDASFGGGESGGGGAGGSY